MPKPGPRRLVGVGVESGALEALERLFKAIPGGTGAAFIVQQHATAGLESRVRDVLARTTTLEVRPARDGALIEPNIVYVAPASREMMVSEGRLLLSPRYADASLTLPIDRLFRSLARDAGPRAVGVLLAKGGCDGPRGAKLIQEAGGVAICQSGESGRPDLSPTELRATGIVARVLSPEAIANALCRLLRVSAERDVARSARSLEETDGGELVANGLGPSAPAGGGGVLEGGDRLRLLRAEAAVRKLEARLEQEIDLRERLSTRLSHELRNPLMALLNAAGILAASDSDSVARERVIPIVDRQARRLARMLNGLLDGMVHPDLVRDELDDHFVATVSSPAQAPARGGARPLRVLVVEDQEDNRDLLRLALERQAYDVRTAEGVRAAIEHLEDELPDVAVIDIGLADGSGIDVARAARALDNGRFVRLIALTGHGQPRDRERILDAGFDTHLVKPISMQSLIGVIRRG